MASGSIKSGSYKDSYGRTQWFQFDWSSSVYSAGVSKITWTFKSRISSNSGSTRSTYAYYKLSASISSGSLYSGSLPSASAGSASNHVYLSFANGATYSGSGKAVNHSGTFYVKHTSSGAASVKISIAAQIYNNTSKNASGTISISGNYPYTACGAPTTVTVSPAIVVPGGTVTISWSGATSGTANTVNGYDISISGATVSSRSVSTTSGSGSITVTASSTRGTTITASVRTKGTAGSSYYSGYRAGNSIVVNSLPAAPSVTPSRTTVPSTGGSVTFTVAVGSDANSQTRTLYVAVGSGGRVACSTTYSYTVTSTTTFYFYTFDGLEYSAATAKTITVNVKPALTKPLGVSDTSAFYNTTTWKGPPIVITPSYNKGKVTITLKNKTTSGSWTISNAVGATSAYTIPAATIFSRVKAGEQYYFDVSANDGIESSVVTSTTTWSIPATLNSAAITRTFNNLTENIGYNSNTIFNKVRVYLPADSICRSYSVTTNVSGANATISGSSNPDIKATVYDSSQTYVDISISNNLTNSIAITFTITAQDSTGSLSRVYTITKNRINAFPNGTLTVPPTMKYWSSEVSLIQLTIPAPATFITDSNYQWNNFEIPTDEEGNVNSDNVSLTLTGSTSKTLLINSDNFKIQASPISDATIYFTLNKEAWTSLIKSDKLYDNQNTNITLTLAIKNVFNYTANYTGTLRFDFLEPIQLNSLTAAIEEDNLNKDSILLREGATIQWDFENYSYNPQNYTYNIYIYRSKTSLSIPTEIDIAQWTLYKSISSNFNAESRLENGLIPSTVTTTTYQIPLVSDSNYIYFKAEASGVITGKSYDNSEKVPQEIAVGRSIRHVAPTINITSSSYEKNPDFSPDLPVSKENFTGTIIIGYQMINSGVSVIDIDEFNYGIDTEYSPSVQLVMVNPPNDLEADTLYNTSVQFNWDTPLVAQFATGVMAPFQENSVNIFLLVTTHLSLDKDINTYNKIYNSAVLTVYNISPTVALRYQHIGINNQFFESNDLIAMAIGDNGRRYIIRLLSDEEEHGAATINLRTGELDNFIIDGGTW